MPDKRQLEFFLLRYVPDAVKNEFVNIGVVMFEPGANGAGFADVRFTRDWRRVRCMDPDADVEMLEALERDIRGQLRETRDREALLRKLQDSFSNVVQLSPTKACLAEEPAREMGQLASLYLETNLPAVKRSVSGRQGVLAQMTEAFQSAGILKLLMRDVSVALYTKLGDPMKFDFGYPVGSEIKFLHAVSLRAGVDQAVTLAARFPTIVSGIKNKKNADARLTAVVDDDLDQSRDEVGFVLSMMEENRIRVARAAEIPGIAEEIRRELRA